MTIAIAYWVLMLIFFVFGLYSNYAPGPYGGVGNTLLLFVLFLLIGWHAFGAPIHG